MELFTLSANLKLDTSEYEQGVKGAVSDGKSLKEQLDNTAESASSLGDVFKGALGANFAADFLKNTANAAKELASESIGLASNLNEVQNVVDVTFGTDSKRIDRWAKQAKSAFGIGELAAKKYSGTLGAMLKSMGLSSESVVQMSEDMVELAGNMASFYNLDTETAFEKIRAGIAGQTQPLQQLGINMSVANLQAFALSQGITKTYDAMSQAEQAQLRYNYLMSVTADAQGDFARTSTEYANGTRLLGENIATLKSNIGEVLLPIVTDVVNSLNALFAAAEGKSLSDVFGDIDQTVQDQTVEANDKYAQVDALIKLLETMEEDGEVSADELDKWNTALRQIVKTVPELSSIIDLQTGSIEGGTAALRENAQAWRDNLIEQAKQSAIAEKYQAYVEALAKQTQIEIDLSVNEGSMQGAIANAYEAALPYAEEYANLTGRVLEPTLESLNAFAFFAKNPGSTGFISRLLGSGISQDEKDMWSSAYDAVADYLTICYDAGFSIQSLSDRQADLAEQTSWAEEELRRYAETLGINIDDLFGGVEATDEYTAAVASQVDAYNNLKTAMEEIEAYRADVVSSMRSSIESVTKGFEEMGVKYEASVDDMLAGLSSQKSFIDQYANDIQSAAALGIDKGLLASLSDGSKESAEYLRAIVADGGKHIDEFNEQWKLTENSKDILSQAMADAQLAVDPVYDEMITAAEETAQATVDAFNQAEAAKANALATGQAVADGLAESSASIRAEVSTIASHLSILGSYSYAYARANAYQGPSVPGHAVGLDYVPYNDYYARLHEGEAVLTKAEATDWRRGESGNASSVDAQSIASAVASAVASALNGAAVTMDGQIVGNLVTDQVSRNIAEGMTTTRRYAMA